jgi:hypothetical protein
MKVKLNPDRVYKFRVSDQAPDLIVFLVNDDGSLPDFNNERFTITYNVYNEKDDRLVTANQGILAVDWQTGMVTMRPDQIFKNVGYYYLEMTLQSDNTSLIQTCPTSDRIIIQVLPRYNA